MEVSTPGLVALAGSARCLQRPSGARDRNFKGVVHGIEGTCSPWGGDTKRFVAAFSRRGISQARNAHGMGVRLAPFFFLPLWAACNASRRYGKCRQRRCSRNLRTRAAVVRAAGGESEQCFDVPRRQVQLAPVGSAVDVVEVETLLFEGGVRGSVAGCVLGTGVETCALAPPGAVRIGEMGPTAAASEGSLEGLSVASVPALRLLGRRQGERQWSPVDVTHEGLWKADGWRAQMRVPWEAWVKEATANGGRLNGSPGSGSNAFIEWTVLPSSVMTPEQLSTFVGRGSREYVEGTLTLSEKGGLFEGKGAVVEPKGLFACGQYTLRIGSDVTSDLLETRTGTAIESSSAAPGVDDMVVPGPFNTALPGAEAPIAKMADAQVDGMLGQRPLYSSFDVDVDPARPAEVRLYIRGAAKRVAEASGLQELRAIALPHTLLAVLISAAGGEDGGQSAALRAALRLPDLDNRPSVPAIVDSAASVTCLNWPALQLLFGLNEDSPEVSSARRVKVSEISLGSAASLKPGPDKEVPMLSLDFALVGFSERVGCGPVDVVIDDLDIFDKLPCEDPDSKEQYFGRSDQGFGFFGFGPAEQRPAAVLGQDVLSQRRYILSSASGRMFMAP